MVKLHNSYGLEISVTHSTFPAGEVYVKILDGSELTARMTISLLSADSESIMRAMMLADAVRELGASEVVLYAEYLPYSRQDRVCSPGESNSLAMLIAMFHIAFDEVITLDLHNPLAVDLGLVINLGVNYDEYIEYTEGLVIVSPDKGAVSRCFLAADGKVPVAVLNKSRGATGIIQCCSSTDDFLLIRKAKSLLIVDDICDGGATFLSAAKLLRELNPLAELHLLVTHGIFSQGMEKLEEVFTTVKAVNPYSRNRLEVV